MSYLYTCTVQREPADLRWPRPSYITSPDEAISNWFEARAAEGLTDPADEWPRHLLVTAWERVTDGYRQVPEAGLVVDVPAWVRRSRHEWLKDAPVVACLERLEARNPRGVGPQVREGWLEVEAVMEGTIDCDVCVRAGNGRNMVYTVPRHAVDLHLSAVLVTFWEKPLECWVELPKTPDVAGSTVLNVERSQVRPYHC